MRPVVVAACALVALAWVGPARAGPADPRGVIHGRILDAEGRPVAGAQIMASPPDPLRWIVTGGRGALERGFRPTTAARFVAQSGADGRFHLAGLAAHVSHHLQIQSAKPLGAAGVYAVARPSAAPSLDVVLLPGRRVTGRLVNASGKALVGHVSVYGERRTGVYGSGIATSEVLLLDEPTDAEGRFAFVAPSTRWLRIDGHVPAVGRRSIGLDAGPGDATVELALRLPKGCQAAGRVLDEDGTPISGALVHVAVRRFSAYRGDGRLHALARADAEGRWEIAGLPEGTVDHVLAAAPGHTVARRWSMKLPLRRKTPWITDFVLGTGARIQGRVLDGHGKPVVGARVTHTLYSATGSVPAESVVTGATGRYAFEGVAARPGWLQVEAAGMVVPFEGTDGADHRPPSYATPAIHPGETYVQDLRLARGRVLRGRVLDAEGLPVAGATGLLTMTRGTPVAGGYRRKDVTLWTDEDGRFELHGVARDATLSLTVQAKGYGSRTVPVHLGTGDDELPIQVRLGPATILRGRVLDATGRPMPHVPVGLSPNWIQGHTDAAGRFELQATSGGTLRLHLGASMHAALATLVVDVPEGGTREGLELRWPEGGVLGGTVVDEQGAPRAGALVTIAHERNRSLSTRAFSDATGQWRFEHVPMGTYRISVEGQWPPAANAEVGREDVRVVLRADEPELIDGLVLGPDGRPVASGTIAVARPTDGPYTQRGTAVILGGRFRVARPADLPGPLALAVTDARDAHGRPFPGQLARVVVEADTPRPVEIRLEAAGEVAGRVVDADGEPVPGIVLTLQPHQTMPTNPQRRVSTAWTDCEGRFRFVGVASGVHTLSFRGGGAYLNPQPMKVEAGQSDVVFEVKRWRTIAGVVLGLDGKPVAGSTVAIGPAQIYPRPHRGAVSTDERGRFEIPRVMPGKTLFVSASPPPGYEGPAVAGGTPDVAPGARDVVVRLRRGLSIGGVVRGIDGEPVAGCLVTTKAVRTKQGGKAAWYQRPKATTDAQGRFELRTFLPDLLVDLSFAVPKSAPARYFGEVRRSIVSGTQDVAVRMEPGVVIRGEIRGAPVALLKGVRLSASPAEPDMRPVQARTTLDGTTRDFEIGLLKPGPYRIRLSMRTRGALFLPPEVRAEAPTDDLLITVERAWSLSGRVLTKNPRGYVVSFHPPEGRSSTTTIRGTDGAFRIRRLRDHPGQLLVRLRGSKRMALLEGVKPSAGPFDVELAEGLRIAGRIGELPDKLRSGKITARRGNVRISSPIDEDGWFETAPLPPGTWELEVEASRPRGGRYRTPKKVRAGARNVLIRYVPSR